MARSFSHDADWTRVSKNRANAEQRYCNHRFDRLNYISVYVDNLPFEMDEVWLRQIFKGYGEVMDVYIPKKRSSRFNTKFGFIRFLSMEEAHRAIQDLDGFLIRDFNIHVNLAKFSHRRRDLNPVRNSVDFTATRRYADVSDYQVNSNKRNESIDGSSRSFADIVAGKVCSAAKLSVKACEEGNQWLSRSAVAKLPSLRSVESLREAFIADGIWNIQLRSMGGHNYARTECPSSSENNSDSEKKDNVGVVELVGNKEIFEDLADKQALSPNTEVDVGDDKGSNLNGVSFVGESTSPLKSGFHQKTIRPSNQQSPTTTLSVVTKKKAAESPRESVFSPDSNGKRVLSVQSGNNRWPSVGGPSSARDPSL
ncbi:hypothetical protein Vadar_001483 [Vaccinium darrowii]|uniref:Uncharacterized protein n=1 Tax=Vaccinium darrowii TaxID=229202 RepID=A0ACB7ZG86_9ERIC|nr:hypothetical protein Vadar_001483 [Vaccinium darrowii]